MKKRSQKNLCAAIGLLASFVLWTFAVSHLDVQTIGPNGSSVGFAALNGFFHKLTGVHMALYTVTDWLGLVPLCFVLGFALLGLVQLIQRRSIVKVDYSILVLGGFYILVMVAYLLFEVVVINYRPVLIDGRMEASYPSSTTMLVMCVIPTAMMQLNARVKNKTIQKTVLGILLAFTVFMVIGRFVQNYGTGCCENSSEHGQNVFLKSEHIFAFPFRFVQTVQNNNKKPPHIAQLGMYGGFGD